MIGTSERSRSQRSVSATPKDVGAPKETDSAKVLERGLEQSQLQLGQCGEGVGVHSPTEVGATAQRTQLGARGVDQNVRHDEARGHCSAVNSNVVGAGVSGARTKAIESGQIGVGGVHATGGGCLSSKLQCFAAGARAKVHHLTARLRSHKMAQQLAAFVLHFEQSLIPGCEPVQVRAI